MGFSSPKNRFNGVLYKVYIFIQYLLNLTFGKSHTNIVCECPLKDKNGPQASRWLALRANCC